MSVSQTKKVMALTALVTLITPVASAQSLSQSYVEGFELNPIEPTPAGDRFFLVPGGFSDPDAPDYASPVFAKLFLHLSVGPSLVRTDDDTGETVDLVQNQLYAHASVTGYVLPWLMLNADLPIAVYQRGDGPVEPKSAFGDLRFGARFGVLGKRSSAFALSPGVDVWFPTGSTDNLTGDTNFRSEPYVSLGGQASVFIYSAKVGFQFRHAVNSGSIETGDSLTYGAALGLSLFDRFFQIGPEFTGRSLVASDSNQAFSGSVSPMTGALGARFQLGDFNLGAAFGVGLTDAAGNAPRIMLGFSYDPASSPPPPKSEPKSNATDTKEETPSDADGDGVIDSEDACPERMGDPSQIVSLHGCPDSSSATGTPEKAVAPAAAVSSDRDEDGVIDSEDACPDTAGAGLDEDGAKRGCPPKSTAKVATTAAITTAPTKGPASLTWLGFRKLESGNALLYVNLTEELPVRSEVSGTTLVFTFPNARVQIKNNKNPLLTEHFASVVKSARLLPKGKNVQLIVELKAKATSQTRFVKEGVGATFQVELQRASDN